jgi:hypothetical protein
MKIETICLMVILALNGCVKPNSTASVSWPDVADHDKVERFQNVTNGMTKSQVFTLLGVPDETKDNTVRYVAYAGPHEGFSLKLWFLKDTVTNVQSRAWLEMKPPDL